MANSLLTQLQLTVKQSYHLSGKVRTQLLTFLHNWEAHQDVIDCLE